MGNNHNQYFDSDKRKVLLLGLESAGKTTLLNYLSKNRLILETPKTKNLNIEDVQIGPLLVSFFDLSGGERQRVFWKQQYQGAQGILYVIDASSDGVLKEEAINLLGKVMATLGPSVPVAVCLTKLDIFNDQALKGIVAQRTKNAKSKCKTFDINYKEKTSVRTAMEWLLESMVPL